MSDLIYWTLYSIGIFAFGFWQGRAWEADTRAKASYADREAADQRRRARAYNRLALIAQGKVVVLEPKQKRKPERKRDVF